MPTIGWIDALRQYNAGMPSWCVPRKGTPGYDRVMRIRQGEEKPKGFKEVLEDLERKTSGKPKGEKKSLTIDLGPSKESQAATLPTIAEGGGVLKTDESTQKKTTSHNKEKMSLADLYVNDAKKGETTTLWKLEGDTFVKVAHWYIQDQGGGLSVSTGIKMTRPRVGDKLAYRNPTGGKETRVKPLSDVPDEFKVAVREILEHRGYDVSSLPTKL